MNILIEARRTFVRAEGLPKCAAACLVVLSIAFASALVPAPAIAQGNEIVFMRDRIARLEQELESMRRLLDRRPAARPSGPSAAAGGDIPPAAAAQMELRLNQLESQIRSLTGQIERFDFGMRQIGDRLQALASDIDFRLTALEKGGVPSAAAAGDAQAEAGDGGPADSEGATGSASQAAVSSGVLPSGSPKAQYDYAKNLLRRANYQEAEQALLAFVAAYPDGALTGNALYWLGETYYVRGEFKLAAIRFAEGYKRFPDHPKGPDNLLKLGMSLGKLNKNREACTSLSQIDRQYPDATRIIRRTAAAQRKKFSCR